MIKSFAGLLATGLLLLTSHSMQAQMNVIQLRNGSNSTVILPSASTTVNLQLPSLTAGTHYLLTSSTDPGSGGLGPILKYGPSSTQNTLAVSASNYLFDISYSASLVNAAALGARITSTATDGNNNATGLTLSATATGSGNAKGLSVSASSSSGTADAVYISSGRLTFLESAGATYVTSFVAGDQSTNITYTLPTSITTNGYLRYEAGGALSWATLSVGSINSLSDASIYGGSRSISVGTEPTSALAGAVDNTSLGTTALSNVTSGTSNTAVGYDALNLLQSGSENTAVGFEALRSVTTTGQNTALGAGSQRNATGTGNTSAGYESGYTISGTGNVALGYRSLRSNTSGSYNTGIGYESMYGGASGSYNVGIGYWALKGGAGSPNTGSYNIAVGGNNAPNLESGGDNVMLGYSAAAALTTGSQNVIIGKDAGDDLTTGTGNVIIGYAVGSANNIDTESNLLLIDNSATTTPLIEGNFSDGSEYVKVNGDLQVSGGGLQLGAAGAVANVATDQVEIFATNYAAVQISSNNDAVLDVVTITGGTDGMLMHIYFNNTGTNDVQIGGVTHTIADNKSAGITACRINGTWRVVALVNYP
jgi:hypothetical protein